MTSLTLNPWVILGILIAFLAWSGLIGVKAYNRGQTDCEASYLIAEAEQQLKEAEAAAEVSKKRQEQRKTINKSGRKISNEAKKYNDDNASPALRSYADGLWKRWNEDHK